jgi:hypothetical protein
MKSSDPMNSRPGPVGIGGSGANHANSPLKSASGNVVVGLGLEDVVAAAVNEVAGKETTGTSVDVLPETAGSEHPATTAATTSSMRVRRISAGVYTKLITVTRRSRVEEAHLTGDPFA